VDQPHKNIPDKPQKDEEENHQMTETVSRMIVMPQDGSEFAIKSVDYLNLMFGPKYPLNPVLCYVMPSLPPSMIEAGRKNNETADHLKKISHRNETLADEILGTAKNVLIRYGFPPENIQIVCQGRKVDIAKDIAKLAGDKMADGILLNCHGRSRVEVFFMGEVSLKLLECSQTCPVWLLRGNVSAKDVLIAMDNSENALKAVDYAGFMLSGTQSRIVLFHTKKSLRRFLPKAIFEDIPGIGELWSEQAEQEIAPAMIKAKQMLLSAGVEESRIQAVTCEGSRHTEKDVLAAAAEHGCGTIVLGRRGESGDSGFCLGTIVRKLIDAASDVAVWVV
jgi:nucleotide-binding universal stress UspA family protein